MFKSTRIKQNVFFYRTMCDEEFQEMELVTPKTPLFKHTKIKMTYTGNKNDTLTTENKNGKNPLKNSDESVSLGDRIILRKELIQRRRWIVDLAFVLAMAGIILMMIETELFIIHNVEKTSIISIGIKCVISVTTAALLVTILLNYYTGIQIKVLDTGVKDYLPVITTWSLFCLFLELAICAPHPFPADIKVTYISPSGDERKVSIDGILSIIMMIRLYLVGKFAVVHSRLLTDTSTNSIGALSKVKINASFVFKAAMTTMPGILLILVMAITFLVNTWSMRTCEIYYEQNSEKHTYLETMWLIAITFLTVGYGDTTPQSYCGRYISILTGGMGVVTTALLVAIMARNLEQTRPEKYVFNFVSRMQIESRKKKAAANAIKSLFKIWILRKKETGSEKEIRRYSDRLKQALKEIRITKHERAHVGDDAVGMVDVSHTVNKIYHVVGRHSGGINKMEMRINTLELRLSNIEDKLNEIRMLLSTR